MNDELENFIREHKARVAEDKVNLGQDPPYMEIKTKPCEPSGSSFKENIPHKFTSQEKGDTCIVGLPLGVDYEKKKKRLQYELRMDYRRYMSQQKSLEGQPAVFPQKLLLERDAAAVTQNRRLLKEDAGSPSVFSTQHDWKLRPDKEEYFKDDVVLTEGQRRSDLACETAIENSQSTKREVQDQKGAHMMQGRRLRAVNKTEHSDFATGLIIGSTDTDEVLQRRKERYRLELQEQIAEQHRNKKKEKDLELRVAATGAKDPEKQPDRIREFGLSWQKDRLILEPLATGKSEPPSKALPYDEKTDFKSRERPSLELPHVAFPSPLVEYSYALGLEDGDLPPNSQSAAHTFPVTTDMARSPAFCPPPHLSMTEAYRSPYGRSHHYYRTQNMLDPNVAYYEHLALPGARFPISYWNAPYEGAVPSQFGNHNHHTQHSVCIIPESAVQPSSDTAFVDSQVGCFPSEIARSTRDLALSYRDALKQQEAFMNGSAEPYNEIQEQNERKRLEREETARYEAQLQADMKNHLPWGRGGGGAPLKDSSGNLFADLNQMHKLNEEAYSKPDQWLIRTKNAHQMDRLVSEHKTNHKTGDRVPGFTHVQTPQFPRYNVFANQPSEQHQQEQDKYKAYLKQQIEEKMCKKAEEREQIRLEEEKEEKRLAEQRARIHKEYEEEQERKKQKQMEQKAKNEELIQLAEQTKKEAERKRKEVEEKENAALLKQYERERQAQVEVHREPSPPIPTLQNKHGHRWRTPRPPTVDSSSASVSEHSLFRLQSPPVPACRNQLRAAVDSNDVFSELSALRHHLNSEQKRLESNLELADWEELESPMSIRPRECPAVDVFDMARLRLQASVRRPTCRNIVPRNPFHIHDNLHLKDTDEGSRLAYSEDGKLEEINVANQRSPNYRDSHHRFSSQRSTVQDDFFDLSPSHQRHYLRSGSGGSTSCFLLESESAFMDPLGNASPVVQTPELQMLPCQLSARERRRLAKQSQGLQNQTAFRWTTGHHSDFSTSSEKQKVAPGPPGQPHKDSSPFQRSSCSSVKTLATDPWMHPGTSDTLDSLNHPLRTERLIT